MSFASLHCHSEYSILDGFTGIDEMATRAEECGYSAMAITDHGNMFGAIPFFNALSKTSVKPVIGIEAYFYWGDATERKKTKHNASHIILLAETQDGLKNLFKLSSLSYSKGFYYKPRIDMSMLSEHSKGVIALSACVGGCLNCHILDGDLKEAMRIAHCLYDIMGKDNFFIEYQNHPMDRQRRANKEISKIQKDLGVGGVFTLDSHYARKDDSNAHDVFVCIGKGKKLSDEDRLQYSPGEFYMKTADEVSKISSQEHIQTSLEIAERCNVHPQSGHLSPASKESLRDRVILGLTTRGEAIEANSKNAKEQEYVDRAKMELNVINQTGFGGYFLCLADMVGWGKSQGIEISNGRGSVGGSLVAYLLGITEVDPLKYGLSFERFLNPQRVSMPDIDIDIEQGRHKEFMQHVKDVYGEDCVARLAIFQKIRARSSVKDTGRVMGLPYDDVLSLTNAIPQSNKEMITIESAKEISPQFLKHATKNKKLVSMAGKIEGKVRHISLHASGYTITPTPITDYLPTFSVKGTDEKAVQADMGVAESVGIVKFDFLTLTTLDIIATTKKLVGHEIDAPDDDDETFQMLRAGETEGVFQMATSLMQHITKSLQPKSIEDLAFISAMGRPGAKKALDKIIACARGDRPPQPPHPLLKPILADTYGGFVYQEQLMKAAMVLGNFSMAEADILRKACGKKKPKLMSKQKEKFINGCKDNGIEKEDATKIFSILADFASYGFNKAHAIAYAMLSYKTAYLKRHYPAYYVAACLTHSRASNFYEHMHLAHQCKVKVLRPRIGKSQQEFSVEVGEDGNPAVRYGLKAIKGIGDKTLQAIERAKNTVAVTTKIRPCTPKIVVYLDANMPPDDIDNWHIDNDPDGYELLFKVTLDNGSVATVTTKTKTRLKTVLKSIGDVKWKVTS